ncbi:MAG: S-layer homology domain-containing protein [Oscillospiraceae bacterium]|nr:S-layer homology domain-containing protein [Oscillospiraceae bacterium]
MNKQRTRWISALLAICLLVGALGGTALGAGPEPLQARFNDVGIGNWFFNAVEYVAITGIMGGTSSTRFQPNMAFSRAMVVTTLFRIHHGRPANATDSRDTPFRDVAPGQWYAPYIAWAYANDITEGDNGRFAPMRNVDRQSFATLLFRYAQNMTTIDTTVRQGAQWAQFADRGRIQEWAVDGLTWANYHGLITGETATTIVPGGATNRAQAATILARFVGGPNALPAPAVNARQFMGQSFSAIQPQLGTLVESGTLPGIPHVQYFVFDATILDFVFPHVIEVWVQNGIVVYVDVWPVHLFGAPFHFAGFSTVSTRADARARFGTPALAEHEMFEGISWHDYFWIIGDNEIWITFADEQLFTVVYASRSFLETILASLETLDAEYTACDEDTPFLATQSRSRDRETLLAMLDAR